MMRAEHRIELAGYFVLAITLAFTGGFYVAKGRWAEVLGAVTVFALIFIGIRFTKEGS